MTTRDGLLARARLLRAELDELAPQVTVVGGTSPALFAMPATIAVRPTNDVDLVIATSRPLDWYRFVGALEDRGFRSASEPICRYVKGGLVIDVMTTRDEPLGFTNRWYAEAVATRALAVDVDLHVLTPLYFVATKLDAFENRGADDPWSSHDLEDIIAVLRGRPEVIDDIATGTQAVHDVVRAQLRALVGRRDALDLIRAHLEPDAPTQAQGAALLERLRAVCSTR